MTSLGEAPAPIMQASALRLHEFKSEPQYVCASLGLNRHYVWLLVNRRGSEWKGTRHLVQVLFAVTFVSSRSRNKKK